jgi:protein-S-isoprenylcysteine O-methyltransferase Ste14
MTARLHVRSVKPMLRASIIVVWAVFWIYWLVSAQGVKAGSRNGRRGSPGFLIVAVGYVALRVFAAKSLIVHDVALQAAGAILLCCGLALAVWARVHLGRNWGMPMTQKDEPELVTSGPYRRVRHPIYSGMLLALLGTALATNIALLLAVAVLGAYFVYAARVEEQRLLGSFPAAYPSYRADTKMLIPFVI